MKFRQGNDYWKRVFDYAIKTKECITSQKHSSLEFWWIAYRIPSKCESAICPPCNGFEVFSSSSDKAKLLAENFSKNSNLGTQVSFYLISLLELIWKWAIFLKNAFYFILKALFVFKIFKFLYFYLPLFFPVGHCSWPLANKNFITHFIWHLENEKYCYIETVSTESGLNKEHFYGKIMHKICT